VSEQTETAEARPNEAQEKYWNEQAGPKWVALGEILDAQLEPIQERLFEAAGLSRGERVLDVGCGCGASSVAAAERVGPEGEVLGLDLSEPMLARARERAAGRAGLRFERGDAQVRDLPAHHYDTVLSRFGVMFFADPVAAFANLATALRPQGRLVFACWQPLSQNPWMSIPLQGALQHLPAPEVPPPGAPGPFSLGDSERLRRILGDAGFSHLELEDQSGEITLGGSLTLDEAVDFALDLGPVGAMMRQAADAGPDLRGRVRESVRAALAPHERSAGGVALEAAWRIVRARP